MVSPVGTAGPSDHRSGGTVAYAELAYFYNAMRRLTLVDRPSGEVDIAYKYHMNGRVHAAWDETCNTPVGSDTICNWLFDYDGDGRLTKEFLYATAAGSGTKTFALKTIEHDDAGRRTKVAFQSENRTGYLNLDTASNYTYDETYYWLKQVCRDGSSSEKADFYYDSSDGRVTKVAYGNGARVEYGYDASGALTSIEHYGGYYTTSRIAGLYYQYDAAGNVTKLALDDDLDDPWTYNSRSGDATILYEYDNLHRLTREACQPGYGSYRKQYEYKYWYDGVGNRTKMYYSSSGFSKTYHYYYSPRNELTRLYDLGDGEYWRYEYDLRGNLTKKYKESEAQYTYTYYLWDSQDHLTKVHWSDYESGESRTVEYKYDALGRRVAKRVDGGSWRWYFYDGLKVLAEGTGTSDRAYYTLSPGVIGGIVCRDNNGTKYWFHYDRLGNVVAVTNIYSGSVEALYTMDAFGNVLEITNGADFGSERSTDVQPYHLTTKEYDPDAKLYYLNARWYDPITGRFLAGELLTKGISRDESLSQSAYPFLAGITYSMLARHRPARWNGHVFCLDNPVLYVDVDGEFAWIWIAIFLLAGGIGIGATGCGAGEDISGGVGAADAVVRGADEYEREYEVYVDALINGEFGVADQMQRQIWEETFPDTCVEAARRTPKCGIKGKYPRPK